jgi:L-asparaginase
LNENTNSKIAVVTTGGTIATSGSGADVSVDSSFIQTASQRCDVVPFMDQPSSYLTAETAVRLSRGLSELLEEYDGLVVTHGTDTMEEAAYHCMLTLASDRPVVFTGSQRKPDMDGFDGMVNINDAIRVAAAPESVGRGSMLVFDGMIHSALYAEKVESLRYHAFDSVRGGHLGHLVGGRVLYTCPPFRGLQLENRVGGRVFLLKSHMDVDPDIVAPAVERADAVVVEAYGGGRVPLAILELVEKTAEQKPVVLTTRVHNYHLYDEYGFPGSYRYFTDRESPIILSQLGAVKSAILLKLCMGNGLERVGMIEMFQAQTLIT